MKRSKFAPIVAFLIPIVLFAAAVYVVFLSEPVKPRLDYYSVDSNYIRSVGIVDHIGWAEDKSYVYLSFEDIPEEYSDGNFRIEGENLRIMLENGFVEKVQLGSKVEYVSAPRYFWDGYAMPIVELSVDGEILLTFDEGKANLLEMIQN